MHPYKRQPPKAFWKKAISPYHPMDITDWYTKRFEFADKKLPLLEVVLRNTLEEI